MPFKPNLREIMDLVAYRLVLQNATGKMLDSKCQLHMENFKSFS